MKNIKIIILMFIPIMSYGQSRISPDTLATKTIKAKGDNYVTFKSPIKLNSGVILDTCEMISAADKANYDSVTLKVNKKTTVNNQPLSNDITLHEFSRYLHVIQDTGINALTNIFQVFNNQNYNRLLLTDNGLLVFGKQHIPIISVDALFLGGTRNSVTKANSGVLGQYNFNSSDSSIQIGSDIDSVGGFRRNTFGSGTNHTTRLKNRINNSTAIGANDTCPAITVSGKFIFTIQGADVASATTITPTSQTFRVTGTTAIVNINIPLSVTGKVSQLTIIPTGVFTTTTAGNIGLASTAVVGKALIMTYLPSQLKWYPSY